MVILASKLLPVKYREPSNLYGRERPAEIHISNQRIVEEFEWTTDVAPIRDGSSFVVGTRTKRSGRLIFVDRKSHSYEFFKPFEASAVASLSSVDELLLAGHANHKITLYSTRDNDVSALSTFSANPYKNEYGYLEQVAFNKFRTNSFLTRTQNTLKLWMFKNDYALYEIPVTLNGFNENLSAAEWSPHDPSLTIASSGTGAFLIDHRLPKTSTSMNCKAGIYNLKWNPFVPFWISASGSECIDIFDLRFASKSPLLRFNQLNTSAVCWSNSHSELLLACCSGRTVSLLNLNDSKLNVDVNMASIISQPEGQGQIDHSTYMQQTEFLTIVVFADPKNLNSYYGLTIEGTIATVQVEDWCLEKIAHHKYDADLPSEIESGIYIRDFTRVYDALVALSVHADGQDQDILQDLTKRAFPRSDKYDWKAFSLDNMEAFSREVEASALSIPAGFDIHRFFSNDKAISKAIQMVRFKADILSMIEDPNALALIENTDKILSALAVNQNYFQASLLKRVVQIILPHSKQSAIDFIIALIRTSKTTKLNRELVDLVHLALWPTVFDEFPVELSLRRTCDLEREKSLDRGNFVNPIPSVEGNLLKDQDITAAGYQCLKSEEEWHRFAKAIGSVRHAIKLLKFERKMLNHDHCPDLHSITKNYAESQGLSLSTIYCATMLRSLFNAGMFEEFFTEVAPLSQLPTSFGRSVFEFLGREVAPKLDAFFIRAIENQRPSIIFKSISLVIIISTRCASLPSELLVVLEDRFPSLIRRFSFEDCHRLSGFAVLKETLSRASCTHTPSPRLSEDIAELKRILLR